MAYFSNGTEGMYFDEQCHNCIHGMNDEVMCPIVYVQTTYNYDQLNKGNEQLRDAMTYLVDERGDCQMKKVMEEVGIKFDLSERDQIELF